MLFIPCQKLFLFLRYLHFCPDCFSYVQKQRDKKAIVNFKIYDVTDWKKIIIIHISPNILRSEDNQITKFG